MVIIEQQYIDHMVEHAQEEFPNECCGILAGKDGRFVKAYRARNAEESPYRYNMDHQDLLRIWREVEFDNDWQILAIYHSHTFSEAFPSQTDIGLALYPDAYYVLVSLADLENPVVRAFRINREERLVTEEPIEIVPE